MLTHALESHSGPADDTIERLALALVSEILARQRRSANKQLIELPARATGESKEKFVSGSLIIDPRSRSVHCEGKRVELTYLEFELLVFLARSAGAPVHKETLRATIWGGTIAAGSRSIDQHVHEIRRKLGDSPEAQIYVRTVRKVGYVIEGEWTHDS
jgi:DNA-binding response OmpR family regulator